MRKQIEAEFKARARGLRAELKATGVEGNLRCTADRCTTMIGALDRANRRLKELDGSSR